MWSEGICGDGAAVLNDGVMTPIEDVVRGLNERDRYRNALEDIANLVADTDTLGEAVSIAVEAMR